MAAKREYNTASSREHPFLGPRLVCNNEGGAWGRRLGLFRRKPLRQIVPVGGVVNRLANEHEQDVRIVRLPNKELAAGRAAAT